MENIIDDNDAYFRLKGECQFCHHPAHCGHSCTDETCDHCSECGCVTCKAEAENDSKFN